MLFNKLKLNYFGRFQNKELELKPGINLIYGDNEAGKSTIHTFIKGMLFGIERMRGRGAATKEDMYTRYLPWDYPGAYGGSMDLRIGDKDYRLQRSFHANDKNFTILELSTGREVKLKEGLISELLPGLTETTFKNTISIEQLKAQTDSELAAQVRNYIANLSIAKNKEVNVAKAVSLLTEQRKLFESTQNLAALKALQAEIAEGLEKEERTDRLTLQLKELLAKEAILKQEQEKAGAAVDQEEEDWILQLPAILEKYRSYQELTKQITTLELSVKELQAKISSWEMEQQISGSLKEDIKEAEQQRLRIIDLDKQGIELQSEKAEQKNTTAKNALTSVIPALILAVFVSGVSKFELWGIASAILLLVVGTALFMIRERKARMLLAEFEQKELHLKLAKTEAGETINEILKKNQVVRIELLAEKQQEVLKNYYALENARQQKKEQEDRIRSLEESQDVLYETIMKYIQHFLKEDELNSLTIQRLQEEVRGRRQKSQERQSEINKQQEACRLQIERLRWEISQLEGNEDQLLKNQERYGDLEKKQKEGAVELEAIKLALSTIQELSTDIHDSFGQQLNEAVSEVISEVTGQKYTDLKVDEKLDVKVGWNGDYVLLDRLSAGTIDQIYFALRLAVADLLLGKDEIPLLLDDSFALYDEARVRAALKKVAGRKQTVLFSCHRREQELLEEMNIPYHLVDLSCQS